MRGKVKFSSDNDPDLGPDPNTVSLPQLLVLVYLAASALLVWQFNTEHFRLVSIHAVSLVIVVTLFWCCLSNFRARSALIFAAGATVFTISLAMLLSLASSEEPTFGVLLVPFLFLTLAVGFYATFCGLDRPTTKRKRSG